MADHYFINAIGNPLDSTVAVGYLVFDGVLERFPKLKIVVAHGGGYVSHYPAAHGPRVERARGCADGREEETASIAGEALLRHDRVRSRSAPTSDPGSGAPINRSSATTIRTTWAGTIARLRRRGALSLKDADRAKIFGLNAAEAAEDSRTSRRWVARQR